MPKAKSSVEIKNRRASFDYEFIETFQAGLVLTGTEIKSIRAGKASLVDAFCYFNNNELYVKNMHIAEYWWGSWGKHDPRRERKLLLTRKELTRLSRAVKEKGLTIVGVKLYIADNGYILYATPDDHGQLNTATNLATINGWLPVSANLEEAVVALGLEKRADISNDNDGTAYTDIHFVAFVFKIVIIQVVHQLEFFFFRAVIKLTIKRFLPICPIQVLI